LAWTIPLRYSACLFENRVVTGCCTACMILTRCSNMFLPATAHRSLAACFSATRLLPTPLPATPPTTLPYRLSSAATHISSWMVGLFWTWFVGFFYICTLLAIYLLDFITSSSICHSRGLPAGASDGQGSYSLSTLAPSLHASFSPAFCASCNSRHGRTATRPRIHTCCLWPVSFTLCAVTSWRQHTLLDISRAFLLTGKTRANSWIYNFALYRFASWTPPTSNTNVSCHPTTLVCALLPLRLCCLASPCIPTAETRTYTSAAATGGTIRALTADVYCHGSMR